MSIKEIIELYEYLNNKEERIEDIVNEQADELFRHIREIECQINSIKEIIGPNPLSPQDYQDLPFPEVEEDIPLF